MLTRRILEMSLVAAVATYLTAMVLVFSSSEQPCPETNKQCSQNRAEETSNGQQDESFRHWMMHDAAGFFTLWLAIVGVCQLVLFWVQLKFIRESLSDAKIAAEAARDGVKVARDEFNATHRPKLRVRCMKPNPFGNPVEVQYAIVNVGETPAIIKRHEITLCKAKETLQGVSLECPQLERGESRTFGTNFDAQFEYGWGIAADSSILTIQGIVEYEDKVGILRRTGFLRIYDARA
jgi:hypothetical protein